MVVSENRKIKPEIYTSYKGLSKQKQEISLGYTFLIPALVSLILFVFGPLFFAFIMSIYHNPTAGELRQGWQFYKQLSNLAMGSLRKFFVADTELDKGVLKIEGLFILLIALVLLGYARGLYRKMVKSPKNSMIKSLVVSSGLSLIPAGIVYFIGQGQMLFLLIGIIIFIGSSIGILFFLKKKKSISRPIYALVAIISGLIIAPLIIIFSGWFFDKVTIVSSLIKLPFDNYRVVLTDIELNFLRVLFNTVFWTVVCVGLHVVLGILLAILLNRDFPGRTFFRGIFILPWAIPSFVSTLIWRNFIFDKDNGFLNSDRTHQIFSGNSYIFNLANLLVLLISFLLILAIVVYVGKLFQKIFHIKPSMMGIIRMLLLLLSIPVGIYFYSLVSPAISGVSWLSYKLVDIPQISKTFWFTDDVFLFGIHFKMITFSAILINVWLGVPFMMVSFLAALQSIPKDLYEAARIDGASEWQQFKKITFPLLKPTIFTVSLLGFVWTFNLFNVVYLLSQNQTGLGNATDYTIFVTFIYDRFMHGEYATAASLSFVIFLMLISFSAVYKKVVDIDAMFVGNKDDLKNEHLDQVKLSILEKKKRGDDLK
ncbi:MAG: carbohydrate ABC transporter permease [Promethearchaeota archaeon]